MKLIPNIFFLALIVFCNIAFAQNNTEFQRLDGENVSTQSITYAIKQDSIGNIWIASEEGVLKHNSKYYKVYNTYNGLPESVSNRTKALFIDSKQRVWIGLGKGLCLYDDALDIFNLIGNKNDINPSLINAITEDAAGNIWIGGFNGLWKYNIDSPGNKLSRIVSNHNIQALFSIKDQLVFGTSKGLFVYNTINDDLEEIKLGQESKNVTTINLFNNTLLIGTEAGAIFKLDFNLKKEEVIAFEKTLTNPIKDIVKDTLNNIYVATDGDGLYYLNNDFSIINHFKEDVDNQNSISSNGLYDIELGNEDILWIATYGGGVNFFDSNKLPFQKIQHQANELNSINSNFSRAIAEDKNGNLWFGTKYGVSILDVENNTWKHIRNISKHPFAKSDIVLALEPDDNYMWVGTYNNGFFKLNVDNFKHTHYNFKYPSKNLLDKVYTIYKDSKNNIWIGGIQNNTIVIRENNTIDTYPIQEIKSFVEVNSGNLIAVGRNGAYIIDDFNSQFKLIEALVPNKNTLAFSTINAIHETNEGNLILATNGAGLVFYNTQNQSIKKLTVNSGMPSDIIQGIVAQNDDNIWVSTTKGLAHITTASNDTLINVFDKKDGLASTEYNYGSYAKLNNSLFAFGGVNGISLFNPEKITGKSYKPVIVFDEFKLFNKAVEPGSTTLKKHINVTETVNLKYKENSIELKFTGVLHSSPSKIKYSWKLDGFSEDWSLPSYTNFATFTNLNSGEYIFRVKASNKYGDFGQERVIGFNVMSPWWLTNQAFFLYFLAVLISLYLIVHFTRVIVKKKIADEQVDFFNNISHQIKTPLTILLSSLDDATENTNSDSRKRVKTTIKRINSLFEQMLNFHKVASQDKITQHISEIDLENHLKQLMNDFKPLTNENGLEIIIKNHWNDSLFYYDINIFNKIIRNLISNAIKYSFDNGKITIDLFKTNSGKLKIEIIDNGLGIPKDQQKYILKRYYRARNVINSQRPGTGLGLIMIQKLINKTGGSISFVSEENKGTTFTIVLENLQKAYNENLALKENPTERVVDVIDDQIELGEFSDSKILIVEDNDELRAILVNTLGVHFQMYEAKNGIEGLEIAHQVFPDMILTDLIMPEMDGMQMSRKLKADINLNHIPVFMLTVLQNSEQKLESIETGISEYIEKPIDMNYLLAKMTNTLKWQQSLRQKYVHESESDNATLFRNKNDQEFLKTLESNIIKNIDNSSFSVHDLSGCFGMSRTSLYMKLKNLVDLSPQDFIIHSKLKHAKNLLIKGESSIKEVAYSSGFSNPKYFSTSFKKFYGITPSGYIESLQK